ncbi:alanine--tRNA ligase, partial [bacterium]|nr:alanine--tRNA ligase [bacterium]
KQQAAMALTEDGIVKPEFEGYDKTELEGSIVAMFNSNFDKIDSLSAGDTAFVVLSPMLFYAESGGQVGDRGFLDRNGATVANVVDCIKLGDYQAAKIVADVDMVTGFLVKQKLCEEIRNNIRCNHSATHLLHLCLHEVVGPHANQSGSLVSPEKMRFDFTHYAALTDEQILELERCVNKHIQENYHVCTAIKKIDEAKEDGAMSLFGEKYGEVVRVVTMGGSKELCGGTHIKFTGQIGFFKIVKEEGIAAGVRRIEAVTGMGALRLVQKREQLLADISAESGVEPDLVVTAIAKIKESEKQNKRELTLLRQKLAASQADSFTPVATVNDIPLFVIDADGDRPTAMSVLDSLKSHNKDGLFLVLGSDKGRGLAIVALNGTAKKQFNAGNILKDILKVFGGKGGGRPDMAQGSAPETIELDKAIKALKELI